MNRVKIVFNRASGIASYQFQNDRGQWVGIPATSPLSLESFSTALTDNRTEDLVKTINSTYNVNDCGVEIVFIGDNDTYSRLERFIADENAYHSISCSHSISKSVVIGRQGAGKTTLINGIYSEMGLSIGEQSDHGHYELFEDTNNTVRIYEVEGISIEQDVLNKMLNYLSGILAEGASSILYCFSNRISKFEQIEIDLIRKIEIQYPGVKVFPIVTRCDTDGNTFADKISKELGGQAVPTVLAQASKIQNGMCSAFGLDLIVNLLGGDLG